MTQSETEASGTPSFGERIGGIVKAVTAWALSLRIVRAFLHYADRRGAQLADAITYRALFSIFAGVLLGFSLAALWLAGNPEAWDALVSAVSAAIPGLVGDGGIIDTRSIDAPAGFTVAGVISAAALVGAAIGAITSLRLALRSLADQVSDDVLFVWVLLRNLAIALGIGVAFAVTAAITWAASAGIDIVAGWLGFSSDSGLAVFSSRAVGVLVVFVLDAVVIAVLFRMLSGLKPTARQLWPGALIGAVGLTVLQQLSSLFVGGATSNPLFTTFASLIALLLWINLSCQVLLIASAYIVVSIKGADALREPPATFAERRVQQAEERVRIATEELRTARLKAYEEEQQS